MREKRAVFEQELDKEVKVIIIIIEFILYMFYTFCMICYILLSYFIIIIRNSFEILASK